MARGTQFRVLIDKVRAELGQSTDRAAGINTLESQKNAIRNTYEWLYGSFDWRFLKVYREEDLQAEERIYSFDADLAFEDVEKAWTWHSNSWMPLEFGITPEHFTRVAETDFRDPVERWDAWEDNQYTVWPTPKSAGKLKMYGVRKFKQLSEEKDICLLDDLLVVFFTAGRLLAKGKGNAGQTLLDAGQSRLRHLRAKVRAKKQRPFVLGGGTGEGRQLRPGIDYIPERS